MKVMILLGAPGSGKGTVAEKLKKTGYMHISTGDMLREALKNATEIGRKAEGYMKRGELVPDGVIIQIVEDRLDRGKPDDSYMFDGFPRTVAQAELLDKSLAGRGGKIDHVFFLDSPQNVLIQRLTGRRTCRNCGWSCHIVNIPPKKPGTCDKCGGELYQRDDDSEATVKNRLAVYNRQTESLISRYEKRGVLARVNSNQDVNRLVTEMIKLLD